VALCVLLAASASAQPAGLQDRGGYVAAGGSSPERRLLPESADPALVAGLRLSEHVDLQVGYDRRTSERAFFSREEVLAVRSSSETSALAIGAGYADRVGPSLLRARVGVVFDHYSASRRTYRPDSSLVGFPPDDVRMGYGLVSDRYENWAGEFVHVAISTSAGLPLRLGPVTVEPTVGVAGSLTRRQSGTLHAPEAQTMPFVRLPLTVRVGDVAVTAESTFGAVFGSSDWSSGTGAFDRTYGRTDGAPLLDGALRVDF
jgi:hypothetical protein